MRLKQRLVVSGLFAAIALSSFAVAKHFSSSMIAYVVEEALVQKLPSGYDPQLARSKFRSVLSELPDRKARVEKLLSMSQYLEKLQVLEPREVDQLLTVERAGGPAGRGALRE